MDLTLHQGGGETSEVKNVPLKLLKGGKGMINLTNMVYKDEAFKSAFLKLFQSEVNHKAYYTIKRCMDKFELRGKEVFDKDKAIKDTYLKKETVKEEGKPDSEKFTWLDQKAAEEEFKKLYESPFDIEVNKMFAADVEHLKFSPVEWKALEPLIHDLDNIGR